MQKSTKILIAVIAIIAVLAIAVISSYNGLVTAKSTVDEQYSNIQTNLQRRSDLIPNLVNTVKGYTTHESEVLQNISDARTKLATASNAKDAAEADSELSSAVSRLLVVVENYPDLKADTQFTALTDELSGSENRISVARTRYNEAAKAYNVKIKKFPAVIAAKLFGFDAVEYFEAAEGAQNVPQVQF